MIDSSTYKEIAKQIEPVKLDSKNLLTKVVNDFLPHNSIGVLCTIMSGDEFISHALKKVYNLNNYQIIYSGNRPLYFDADIDDHLFVLPDGNVISVSERTSHEELATEIMRFIKKVDPKSAYLIDHHLRTYNIIEHMTNNDPKNECYSKDENNLINDVESLGCMLHVSDVSRLVHALGIVRIWINNRRKTIVADFPVKCYFGMDYTDEQLQFCDDLVGSGLIKDFSFVDTAEERVREILKKYASVRSHLAKVDSKTNRKIL